jgi:hypothetical protein
VITLAALWKSWIIAMISDTKSERAHGIAAIINNFSVLINDFPLGDRAINLEMPFQDMKFVPQFLPGTIFLKNGLMYTTTWGCILCTY